MKNSNAELARQLFKNLLEDGQEHSMKEIYEYVQIRSVGFTNNGSSLSQAAIYEAIWHMFRHDYESEYIQTRKGFFQKYSDNLLMKDETYRLRRIAQQTLFHAKEIVKQYHSLISELPGQNQKKLSAVQHDIIKAVDDAIQIIGADNLRYEVMTAKNMVINSEDGLMIEDDHINAYISTWFDVDKRFGLETEDTDEYINLYADYYPSDGRLDVFYIHYGSDGDEIATKTVSDLTDDERNVILQLMKDAGLYELVEQMDEDQDAGITIQ